MLVKFYADGAAPEPRFLYGRAPPGCTDSSEIQDPALYQDLCDRQHRRLHRGQDPSGKLKRLLECPPLTRPAWFWPDMTSEQHVFTFRAFLVRLLQLTRDWAGVHGFRSSADVVYQAALQKDGQDWILKEPCSRPDLVATTYADSKKGLFLPKTEIGGWPMMRRVGCAVLARRRRPWGSIRRADSR